MNPEKRILWCTHLPRTRSLITFPSQTAEIVNLTPTVLIGFYHIMNLLFEVVQYVPCGMKIFVIKERWLPEHHFTSQAFLRSWISWGAGKKIFWLLLHGDLYFAKQKRNQKHGNTEGVWKTANQPNKSKTPNKILQYVSFHFNPTSVAQTIQFSLQWCEAQQIDSESIWRAAPGWVERRCRGRLSQRQRWVPVSLSPFMSKMTERADCGPQCIREAISCSNESVIGTRWRESNTCGWSLHRLRT